MFGAGRRAADHADLLVQLHEPRERCRFGTRSTSARSTRSTSRRSSSRESSTALRTRSGRGARRPARSRCRTDPQRLDNPRSMTAFIIRRIVWTIPVILLVILMTFLLMKQIGGNPFRQTERAIRARDPGEPRTEVPPRRAVVQAVRLLRQGRRHLGLRAVDGHAQPHRQRHRQGPVPALDPSSGCSRSPGRSSSGSRPGSSRR